MEKLLLRPVEAAEAIGISRSKIYELLASGELPSVRIGASVRVPVEALDRRTAGHEPLMTAAAVAEKRSGCEEFVRSCLSSSERWRRAARTSSLGMPARCATWIP